MGLGETQVFQDEKSRLANTTVARIVAAKGSLNDPETKKECCRKLQKLKRAEHGPGDDSDRTRWRRPRRPVRSTSAGSAAAARAVLPIHGSRPRRLNRSEP